VSTELTSCPHESDVLDLVAIDQWPARADEALRTHVAGCAVCGDLALVASAIAAESHDTAPARVQDATVVWYGARLLARREAAERAARPLLVVQGAALAGIALVLFAGWQTFGTGVLDWVRTVAPESWPTWQSVADWAGSTSRRERWFLAALGAWMVLVPLAFYLVRLTDQQGETGTGRSRV